MPATSSVKKKKSKITKVSKKPVSKPKKKVVRAKVKTRPKAKSKPIAAPKKKLKKEESLDAGRLRIRVSAYEHKLLDSSVKQIIDTVVRHGAKMRGPVPLPTEIKKYTVNRASFVYKDSREQFEMRIHKRLIDIINPAAPLIEALTNLTLPSGVSIDVKMM